MADDNVPAFGAEMRGEFMLRAGSVFLNHGSGGAVPRVVHERQVQYLAEMESHPDNWFRFNMEKYMRLSIMKVSEFVGTSPNDTFLLQNATKGMNTVVKSYPLKPGDAFMISCVTYPAVNRASHVPTSKIEGTTTYKLEIEYPIKSVQDVIDQYDTFLDEHPDIKLVLIDHITSPTAIMMPVKELCDVCHKHGAIVAVDGAHAPGQIDLKLAEDLDCDFYIGNMHKWVYTPRGCAFLWRNPKRKHDWLRPLITSHFHGQGLPIEFGYEGTKDDTPYICAMHGIDFYNRIGGLEKILAYTTDLRRRAVEYLEGRWGTKRADIPDSMVAPNLQIVTLPYIAGYTEDPDKKDELIKLIMERFDVQTFIANFFGILSCRLSAQVYVVFDDVVKLADAIETLHKETPAETIPHQ